MPCRAVIALLFVALIAGCGADGEPTPPPAKEAGAGISLSITGKAEIGITG